MTFKRQIDKNSTVPHKSSPLRSIYHAKPINNDLLEKQYYSSSEPDITETQRYKLKYIQFSRNQPSSNHR